MKVAFCLSLLVASVAAFSQVSRREAFTAAAGVAFLPVAANAAVGESPRYSVFGFGDGGAYSEGAAYGTDQSQPLYSPYSVYSPEGAGSLYNPEDPAIAAKKKAVLAETRKRLQKLPGYIENKKWFEVRDELTRFMYETRAATKFLAQTPKQKAAAADFFRAIEKVDNAARMKKGDAAAAAAPTTLTALDAFVASL